MPAVAAVPTACPGPCRCLQYCSRRHRVIRGPSESEASRVRASQRSAEAEDTRLLLLERPLLSLAAPPRLLVLRAEGDVVALFLLLSHLSHDDVRPGLLLLPSMGGRWPPDAAADAGLSLPPGLILCASHVSTSSARLGLGGELKRMTARGGAGSSDRIIVHLGEVGSSPGTAACALARCTRATGIAIDGTKETHTVPEETMKKRCDEIRRLWESYWRRGWIVVGQYDRRLTSNNRPWQSLYPTAVNDLAFVWLRSLHFTLVYTCLFPYNRTDVPHSESCGSFKFLEIIYFAESDMLLEQSIDGESPESESD